MHKLSNESGHKFRHPYIFGVAVLVILGIGWFALGRNLTAPRATSAEYCDSSGSLVSTKPIQSHRSYCLKLLTSEGDLQVGKPFTLTFLIIDDEGEAVKSFEVDREKLLHFIVVRHDLQMFQHVHPELDPATGIFTLKGFSLPAAGPYRLYADFVTPLSQKGPDGVTLNAVVIKDITIGDSFDVQPIGTSEKTRQVDGYTVSLRTDPRQLVTGENMLTFSISREGKPITNLENYLGALGHAVVLRDQTLDYIHSHAIEDVTSKQSGTIDFHVEFPSSGTYKVFLQFKHQGVLETVPFVLPPVSETDPKIPSKGPVMDHVTH